MNESKIDRWKNNDSVGYIGDTTHLFPKAIIMVLYK